MSYHTRIFLPDTAVHVVLYSAESLRLFPQKADSDAFGHYLHESAGKGLVNLHICVATQESVSLLLTPNFPDALPRFMQSLGRSYVRYYNGTYGRKGTLWQGRYKSSLVEDVYVPLVHRYIREIPNAVFRTTCSVENAHYAPLKEEEKHFIGVALQRQEVTGSRVFVKEIERQTGLSLVRNRRGRPKKNNQLKKGRDMYKKLVVLDKEAHKDLKINPMQNLEFAKDVTFLPVLLNEITEVAKTFPVVFTGGDTPSLVAITSLGASSLALNDEYKWIAPYVPAYLRQYPFAVAPLGEDETQRVVLIDEDSSLFSKSKGKQLFTKKGEQSQALKQALEYVSEYDKLYKEMLQVSKIISDAGILEEREISIGEGDEKKVLINGFKVVDTQKLKELDDATLASWVRSGIIYVIHAHVESMKNIQTLFNLAQQKQK